MPRQIVHGALSVLTLVVASSAWAAPAPWVPNTTGNVGPAPTTFNKLRLGVSEAAKNNVPSTSPVLPRRASSERRTDRKFNRMRPSMARVLGLETRSAKEG